MKKIKLFFTSFFVQKTKKIPLSIQNKLLITNDLKKCFTVKEIDNLHQILPFYIDIFTTEEFLLFQVEIIYRKQLIQYCEGFLIYNYYPTYIIKFFFRTAQNRKICDAIWLHISKNKTTYQLKYSTDPELKIFESMFTKRVLQLQQEEVFMNNLKKNSI